MCVNTQFLDADIAGIDQTDMELIGGVTAGYFGTAYLDHFLLYEKDGTTKKTGKIAEDDTIRNGLYIGGGLGVTYLWGDAPAAKGMGIGAAVFGLKELIRSKYPQANIKGTQYISGKDSRGQQTYIGCAKSKQINVDLLPNATAQAQPQQQENIVISNNY